MIDITLLPILFLLFTLKGIYFFQKYIPTVTDLFEKIPESKKE